MTGFIRRAQLGSRCSARACPCFSRSSSASPSRAAPTRPRRRRCCGPAARSVISVASHAQNAAARPARRACRLRAHREQERTRRVLSKRPPSHTQTGPFRRAVVLFRLKSLSTNSEVHSNVASIACILFRLPSRRLEKVKRSAKKSAKKCKLSDGIFRIL